MNTGSREEERALQELATGAGDGRHPRVTTEHECWHSRGARWLNVTASFSSESHSVIPAGQNEDAMRVLARLGLYDNGG